MPHYKAKSPKLKWRSKPQEVGNGSKKRPRVFNVTLKDRAIRFTCTNYFNLTATNSCLLLLDNWMKCCCEHLNILNALLQAGDKEFVAGIVDNLDQLNPMLDSFLTNFARPQLFDLTLMQYSTHSPDENVKEISKDLYRKYFLLLLRIADVHDKKHIAGASDDDDGMLWTKYDAVMSAPRIVDFLSIFHLEDPLLIETIIKSFCSSQNDTLTSMVGCTSKALSHFVDKHSFRNFAVGFEHQMYAVVDISTSMALLVKHISIFSGLIVCSDILLNIAALYVYLFPRMWSIFSKERHGGFKMNFESYFGLAVDKIFYVFKQVMQDGVLSPLQHCDVGSRGLCSRNLNAFWSAVELICEKFPTFLVAYSRKYNLMGQLVDILTLALDNSVNSKMDLNSVRKSMDHAYDNLEEPTEPPDQNVSLIANVHLFVSEVKQLLPGHKISDCFVEQCLNYFKFSVHQTAVAILDGCLPDQLETLLSKDEFNPNIDLFFIDRDFKVKEPLMQSKLTAEEQDTFFRLRNLAVDSDDDFNDAGDSAGYGNN